MKRVLAVLIAVVVPATLAAGAQASHNFTDVVSIGPNGGNGAFAGVYRGNSSDGSKVFFQTQEPLVSGDTDNSIDLYERSGLATTLLSTGPSGGNGAFTASYNASSPDGTKVFFHTNEKLVSGDTDSARDLYMRSGGTTTQVSTGSINGNGNFVAVFKAINQDGTKVFFETPEALVSGDTDAKRDVYQWSGGTTTLISTGPSGGNGAFDAFYDGASADGSTVFFHTDEVIVSSDTDGMQDVYKRSGSTTTHLSIGPAGGNGNLDFDYDAFFEGASADGSKAWLSTDEVLVSGDTDTRFDVYEHSGGTVSLVSTGPAGGNGDMDAFFDAAAADGTVVVFDTLEPIVAGDTDAQYDIYQRSGGATTQVSVGPDGGNGAFFSAFSGATASTSHIFFVTADALVAADTDGGWQDVYDRSGGVTTLLSVGANGAYPANFSGSSDDGTRVFFSTDEPMVASDIDAYPDIYERSGGATSSVSSALWGVGNGDFFAFWAGTSSTGSIAFFETDEAQAGFDTDTMQDVYSAGTVTGYPRPKGATPLRAALVPAYAECTAPNEVHGPSLASPSCNPPAQASGYLTVGSPDANAQTANFIGSVRFDLVAATSDVKFNVSIADVRNKSDLTDYSGEILVDNALRITDKLSGPTVTESATVQDISFPVKVTCTPTVSTTTGSTCNTITTANAITPGATVAAKRTIWQLGQVKVMDGGADGDADTPGDNTLFLKQGLFVP